MIKKYKKKDGSTAYMFVAYLGVDPLLVSRSGQQDVALKLRERPKLQKLSCKQKYKVRDF